MIFNPTKKKTKKDAKCFGEFRGVSGSFGEVSGKFRGACQIQSNLQQKVSGSFGEFRGNAQSFGEFRGVSGNSEKLQKQKLEFLKTIEIFQNCPNCFPTETKIRIS